MLLVVTKEGGPFTLHSPNEPVGHNISKVIMKQYTVQ